MAKPFDIIKERNSYEEYVKIYSDTSKYRFIYSYQVLDKQSNILHDLNGLLVRLFVFSDFKICYNINPDDMFCYVYLDLSTCCLLDLPALANNFPNDSNLKLEEKTKLVKYSTGFQPTTPDLPCLYLNVS